MENLNQTTAPKNKDAILAQEKQTTTITPEEWDALMTIWEITQNNHNNIINTVN